MKYGRQAARLLELLTFVNPGEILVDFLRAGRHALSDELPEIIEDELVFYEALELLEQFSLIRRSQRRDSVVVHRLIQVVLRDELSEEEVNDYRSEVIKICQAAFPMTWDTELKHAVQEFSKPGG